jgi:two-component system nitrogen regulation response regulator GlnG/two-component system response regulator HydG
MQAHLLRLLDGGDYHRLGEATPRRADVRFLAATNRQPWDLKHDFAARFPVRVTMPPLQDRREDIPLLVRHLLRQAARRAPDVWSRFLGEGDTPRVEPRLIEHLLRHPFTLHVRELEEILTRSVAQSRADFVTMATMPSSSRSMPGTTAAASADAPPAPQPAPRRKPTRDEIVAMLEKHGGNQSRTWRELGLRNRFVLHRLLKKYEITATPQDGEPDDD